MYQAPTICHECLLLEPIHPVEHKLFLCPALDANLLLIGNIMNLCWFNNTNDKDIFINNCHEEEESSLQSRQPLPTIQNWNVN